MSSFSLTILGLATLSTIFKFNASPQGVLVELRGSIINMTATEVLPSVGRWIRQYEPTLLYL